MERCAAAWICYGCVFVRNGTLRCSLEIRVGTFLIQMERCAAYLKCYGCVFDTNGTLRCSLDIRVGTFLLQMERCAAYLKCYGCVFDTNGTLRCSLEILNYVFLLQRVFGMSISLKSINYYILTASYFFNNLSQSLRLSVSHSPLSHSHCSSLTSHPSPMMPTQKYHHFS
jgi:hypothetical protein